MLAAITLILLIALTLAACGSSSSTGASEESSGEATSGGETAAVSEEGSESQSKALKALYEGTMEAPSGQPLPMEPGKKVWILSCGQELLICSEPVNAAKAVAEKGGWQVTIFDTKTQSPRYAEGVREATAAKPDGIFMLSADCSLVKVPVEQALKAGIVIAEAGSVDCSQEGGPELYKGRAMVFGGGHGDFYNWQKALAVAKLEAIIAETDGQAKVLDIHNTELPVYEALEQGFQEGIAKCSECESYSLEFSFSDLGSPLQAKVQQALAQYPETNAVFIPDDSTALSGVVAGIKASGRAQDIYSIGGEGLDANLEIIREGLGGEDAGMGQPIDWYGYGGIDTLNSLFHGQPPRNSGYAWQLVDADHNMPPKGSGDFEGPVPYKEDYEALWGLK